MKDTKQKCFLNRSKGPYLNDVQAGRGSPRSGRTKGGCVNFLRHNSSKCRQGEEGGQKNKKFADIIKKYGPLYSFFLV